MHFVFFVNIVELICLSLVIIPMRAEDIEKKYDFFFIFIYLFIYLSIYLFI